MFLDIGGVDWKGSNAHIAEYDSRTVVARDEDKRMKMTLSQDGSEAVVKRIGPRKEYRMLGAFISSYGVAKTQVKILTQEIGCAKLSIVR